MFICTVIHIQIIYTYGEVVNDMQLHRMYCELTTVSVSS